MLINDESAIFTTASVISLLCKGVNIFLCPYLLSNNKRSQTASLVPEKYYQNNTIEHSNGKIKIALFREYKFPRIFEKHTS